MEYGKYVFQHIYHQRDLCGVSQAAILGTMEATTAVARMVALSAVAAVLTTFIMGALSDKLKNRKMFISVGYILWGIVTGMFGFISKENVASLFNLTDEVKILGTTVWFVILMDIVMTFMGSTSNDAAFQAWVTDVTVPRQRPVVETVLSVVGTVSSLAVTGVGSFAQAGTISYKLFFGGLGEIPFSAANPPVTVKAKLQQINWGLKFPYRSICRKTPKSREPISPVQEIRLCPYGCTNLRMTEMPLLK